MGTSLFTTLNAFHCNFIPVKGLKIDQSLSMHFFVYMCILVFQRINKGGPFRVEHLTLTTSQSGKFKQSLSKKSIVWYSVQCSCQSEGGQREDTAWN